MQLAHEGVDGGGPDARVVLAHAGPIGEVMLPVEVCEGDISGNGNLHLIKPLFHLFVEAYDGVRLVLGVPCAEGGFLALAEGE